MVVKRFVMIFAVALIFVCSQSNQIEAGSRVMGGMVVRNIDYLALRTGPSVNYREITRIPPGSYVDVYNWRYNNKPAWYYVNYNGMEGYVYSKYVIITT